jgi:hypothetical protein
MTEAIRRQAWNVPQLARRLEESSASWREDSFSEGHAPDARALKPAADETSLDKESPMKPPPHALPKFSANFKTTTPIN